MASTVEAIRLREQLRNDLVFIRDALQRKSRLLRMTSPSGMAILRNEHDDLLDAVIRARNEAMRALDVIDEANIREQNARSAKLLEEVTKEVYGKPDAA